MVPQEQAALLRKALSDHIEIVTMDLDRVQGTLYVVGPTPSLQPASPTRQALGG